MICTAGGSWYSRDDSSPFIVDSSSTITYPKHLYLSIIGKETMQGPKEDRIEEQSITIAPPPQSTAAQQKTDFEKRRYEAIIVTSWISLSAALILFNKTILTSMGFSFPIFLTTFHLLYATVATRLMKYFNSPLLAGVADVQMDWNQWAKGVLPIAICFSSALMLSNMAITFLNISFIQILKAFTVVSVMIVGWLAGVDKLSQRSIIWGILVSLGVATASYGELNFNFLGVLLQIGAVFSEATRLVMVQKLLSSLKMGPVVTLYFFAPVCFALNLIPLLLFEGLGEAVYYLPIKVGWPVLFLNGTVAFGLNIAVVFLVSATSGLGLVLWGVLKDALIVVGSSYYFGNTVPAIQYFGYAWALTCVFILKSEATVNQWKELAIQKWNNFNRPVEREGPTV
ncbi:hypothetical protein PROFUN_11443 [Planoprotostelium fungivorum]|uniref:Sugar phosphate transporter domain-containing protein n=1 Tax=Planoprotostelium fungivorum TaxID=1890364 RepID=A0A2P6N4V5_9EUKA|nr:hypothetical protein PROFUN_11443 [Planoprotostelium fungivorum]